VSRDRAAEVVATVAGRLADPAAVAATAEGSVDRYPDGRTAPAWQPESLAEGHAGIALLHAELNDRRATHAQLAAANRSGGPSGGHLLYAGRLPGLLFAASAAARNAGDYARLRDQTAPVVAAAVRHTATVELDRVAGGHGGTTFAAYDLLKGLSGAIRLLLACGSEPAVVDHAARALVAIASPMANVPDLPGWYVGHSWDDPDDKHGGHLNLGMAHGAPGILAALAIAYRQGVRVPGLPEAIERIVTWLLAQSVDLTWPRVIAVDGRVLVPSGRPGWCYGVPGLARALQLAGLALDVPAWRALAVRALAATLDQPWDGFGLTNAGLCHGWGGLLQITLRMTWDSGDERLADAAGKLAARVVERFDSGSPFGFRYRSGGEVLAPDRPGFLWGAAGVALAVQAHLAGRPPDTGWDAALLLA
jgi:hypothetical protein